MYNHKNSRNGDDAPLVSDELYKVVMEVRCWRVHLKLERI
jgi:hypothetical protein